MAGRTFDIKRRLLCTGGAAAFAFLMLSETMTPLSVAADGDEIVLTGLARDFLASHVDFGDPEPDQGYGHYAGSVSQVIGRDGAPVQVHGVTNFEIEFGSLVPGDPYAARATVLGAEISWGGSYDMPVTIKCETDTQSFEPFGPFMDPGAGTVNDDANPRHFIFSLDEIYSAETPISVTATSWKQDFQTEDFGDDTIYPNSHSGADQDQMATLVTLPEDGTVTSITAYLDTCSSCDDLVTVAIYSDNNGEPDTMIVESAVGSQSSGWTWETFNIPDTWLAAGDYWLAVSVDEGSIRYDSGVAGRMRRHSNDATSNGFAATWDTNKASWDDRRASMYATYTPDEADYIPYLTARSGDNSPYVLVLQDGDSVPSIPAFQDQTNLAVFVEPYVNVATGKVVLQKNQAIYLFELGTTNLGSSSADFQDLVIMVTLATDPVYFMSPGTNSESLDPIGFKVADDWQDADGNNIAPHLYDPSRGDDLGASGPLSSGGVTSPATFYEWHRDVLGVNMSAPVDIVLDDNNGDGVYEFKESNFFPVDGQLWGDEGDNHNWNFTYSVVANFTYDESAEQFFEFEGGDGVWLFVDGELLIDLGGVDSKTTQHGAVDRLDLVDGEQYEMRLFYANRGKDKRFNLSTNVFLTPGPLQGTPTGAFD